MSFTVLSDPDIRQILESLSPSDALNVAHSLEQALVQYSCHDEQQYQPHRATVPRPDGQITVYMPASTPDLVGVKIVGLSPSKPPSETSKGAPAPGLKCVLTLCDATGQAIGVLNAAELTAFRTSLGSILLYKFRRNTENIVVFGAGKQAEWHIKLALLLRGEDIKSVTVVNRSAQRTQHLIDTLTKGPNSNWPAHIALNVFDEQDNRDAALEALLAESDVIFCTTGTSQPLFPASYLTSEKARQKTRYLAAIGSYRLDMEEVDSEYIKQIIDPTSVLADSAFRGGIVTVDTREGCLQEAGELVKAGVPPEKMVDVGRIFEEKDSGDALELTKWLEEGLVVYKSVGTGVMDLAVGHHLLKLAKARNVGLTAADF